MQISATHYNNEFCRMPRISLLLVNHYNFMESQRWGLHSFLMMMMSFTVCWEPGVTHKTCFSNS